MFDTMTLTKIGGGLFGAWLILLLGKWAAEEIYHAETHGEASYVIEVASTEAEPAEAIDVAALIAAAVKAKVTLIERHRMGGDCLNTGCVPSKAILRSAQVAADMRRAPEFGLAPVDVTVRFPEVMARVHAVIRAIEPHDAGERFTSLGVDCVQGDARILSPWEVEVNGATISARNIIIASGARPRVPDIPWSLGV